MTEPTTAAGRALLERETYNSRSFAIVTADAILAIEAEATAAERQRIAAAVEGLPFLHNHGVAVKPFPMSLDEYRAAVLAILRESSLPLSRPVITKAHWDEDTETCWNSCGSLAWTKEKYGRLTHKHSCPLRIDPFCQTHQECLTQEQADVGDFV